MDQYCRVCMARNPPELISLFQIHDSEDDVIANMIIDCTEVMVSDDDNLPQNICGACLIRLSQAYELRKQCQKSDEAFRAMLLEGVPCSTKSEQTAESPIADRMSQQLQDGYVQEAEDSEMASIASDHSDEGTLVQERDVDEEQNVEYLEEDEDYHEYVDSTIKIEVEPSSVGDACEARTDNLPEAKFISKVEEFPQYSIYHIHGERCCGCHMIFPDIDSLSNHQKQKHVNGQDLKEAKFKCDICFKRFKTNQLLQNHKHAANSNELYYCKICSLVLEDELSFMKHVLSMGDHEEVVEVIRIPDKFEGMVVEGSRCCGCDIICLDKTDLKKHIAETHLPRTASVEDDGEFDCTKCFKRFHHRDELLQHQSERQHYLYRCIADGCTFTTIHKIEIIKHLIAKNLHRKAQRKLAKSIKKDVDEMNEDSHFSCCFARCHEAFDCYEELEYHAETVHELLRIQHTQDRTHSQIVCKICQKGFENEQAYDRHRSSDKNRKYACRTCGTMYVSKSTLMQHERSNCGKVAQYQCTECDKTFVSQGGFRNHQGVHSTKRSHVCTVCGRGFLRKGILKDHMNTVHSKVKLFQCTLCSKSFSSRNVFQSHQMTHTKEKPYQCRHCEKRYYKTSDRTMHENQVHLGIRPFKCNFCTASFIRDRERRLHERTHTKAKLYSCDLCSEEFNKFAEYKTHRFNEHGLDTLRDLGPVAMAALHGEQEQTESQRAECMLEVEVFDLAE